MTHSPFSPPPPPPPRLPTLLRFVRSLPHQLVCQGDRVPAWSIASPTIQTLLEFRLLMMPRVDTPAVVLREGKDLSGRAASTGETEQRWK